jgi:hypothetical protein
VERKADIEQYRDSGQLEKMEAELIQEEIDARRLDKAVSTDANLISHVKSNFSKFENGTLQRVVLTSNWTVVKNEFDIPKRKYMEVQAAFKGTDGKCYKAYFNLFREYEGGGNYGQVYMDDDQPKQEMNCANVNK